MIQNMSASDAMVEVASRSVRSLRVVAERLRERGDTEAATRIEAVAEQLESQADEVRAESEGLNPNDTLSRQDLQAVALRMRSLRQAMSTDG